MGSGVLLCAAMPAAAQEACSEYSVQRGDSLSVIARAAYGSINFQMIWDANRTVIGSNPNAITVGMPLVLPCADGSLPGAQQTTAVAPAAPAAAPAGAPASIHLITGSDYAPFTDEGMAGGGVFTQLVEAAMATVETDAQITFVNDWGAHLGVLLPSGAFDGTFPWLLPNCEAENLAEDMISRCENFVFADPVYEIVTGLVTRADDPLALTQDVNDLRGKRICVPDGYGAIVVSGNGLADGEVEYVHPPKPEDCFALLVDGSLDVVEMELTQAEDIIGKIGVSDDVALNGTINSTSALTVYVHRSNPNAEAIIATLNQGLENIRNNGMWFQTVQTGFSAYYAE